MALENYRDLSVSGTDVSAGFQFEFRCTKCSRKWKSAFTPYRMGQIVGLFSRLSFLFGNTVRTTTRAAGTFTDIGSRRARDAALAEAMAKAEALYTVCPRCKDAACDDCYSTRDGACRPCLAQAREDTERAASRDAAATAAAAALVCPNCRTPGSGGRFCAECGFDMASTHKSCPGCGAMMARQARFCTDCGHGF